MDYRNPVYFGLVQDSSPKVSAAVGHAERPAGTLLRQSSSPSGGGWLVDFGDAGVQVRGQRPPCPLPSPTCRHSREGAIAGSDPPARPPRGRRPPALQRRYGRTRCADRAPNGCRPTRPPGFGSVPDRPRSPSPLPPPLLPLGGNGEGTSPPREGINRPRCRGNLTASGGGFPFPPGGLRCGADRALARPLGTVTARLAVINHGAAVINHGATGGNQS